MSESLYFIAVLPPKKIQEEIKELKQVVADKFGSKHAFNAPAHITLHMPFRWKDKRAGELRNAMNLINQGWQPFEVELKDFAFFEPRVVYVDVVENEKLNQLQGHVSKTCRHELKLMNTNYKDQVFHPHMTIAFRDLKKTAFYEAKGYFESKKYNAQFIVNSVTLLWHDGIEWICLDSDTQF